jgi:hypothetical protein
MHISLTNAAVNEFLVMGRSIHDRSCTGLDLGPGVCTVALCDGGSRGNLGLAVAAVVLQVVSEGASRVVALTSRLRRSSCRSFRRVRVEWSLARRPPLQGYSVQSEFVAFVLVFRFQVDFVCSVRVAVPCK